MARLDQNFEQINDSLNWWAERYTDIPAWSANSRPYVIFARIGKNTASTYSFWGQILVSGIGGLRLATKGTWIVQVHAISGALTMTVSVLAPSSGAVDFGYYDGGDGYWYIGARAAVYQSSGSAYIIGNSNTAARKVSFITPTQSTTAPEGWTTVTPS